VSRSVEQDRTRIAAETGFLIERDPDCVRAPDCALMREDVVPGFRLPLAELFGWESRTRTLTDRSPSDDAYRPPRPALDRPSISAVSRGMARSRLRR
jgi:hypothetical protein